MSILTPHPDRVVKLLQALVRFPSLSTQEKDLVDWLEAEVAATGLLEIERHENNILFHLGEGSPWLLMNSHSDVVPPSSDHEGLPFEPTIRDGRMYGRGTTDAKGCGSAMLTALLELAEQGGLPQGRASFALTVCEETAGEHNGMHALRSVIAAPDAALVGEPTSLQPCIAQKGLLILRLVITGTGGHAARVYDDNAIYKLRHVLETVEKIKFDVANPFIGTVKITPTVVNGGIVKNMAPDRCELILDIRTIPEVPNDIIIRTFEDHLDCEVQVVSNRFRSTATSPDEKIAQACRFASGGEYFGSPTASDWVFLSDMPTVKIGPGHSQVSHTRDENIELDQLRRGVALYKDIITRYLSES